LILFFGKISF